MNNKDCHTITTCLEKNIVEIHLEICRRCWLDCIHCSSNKTESELEPSFSLDSWVNFLNNSDPELNVIVCFTGGEPLNCPTLYKWLLATSKLNNVTSVGLFTSALIKLRQNQKAEPISNNIAKDLALNGASFCYVTLHSAKHNIHDSIVGYEGSHKATVESINNLLLAGIDARVHYVPMKHTINDSYEFFHFVNELKVREVRYLRLVSHGKAKEEWHNIGLSAFEQQEKAIKSADIVRNFFPSIRLTVAGFPENFDCRPFFSGPGCQAGNTLFYIDVKGDVFGCACTKNQPEKKLTKISFGNGLRPNKQEVNIIRKTCLQDTLKIL